MTEEFRKTAPNTVESNSGFAVQWIPHSGIIYRDPDGEWRIDSELLVNPLGILVYEESASLRSMEGTRRESLLSNVRRALEHLGHRVEFWEQGKPRGRERAD
jgi:hypothetical protein